MALQEIRQRRKLSQSQLAKISEVNIKTIQAYEQEAKNINHAKLETLANLAFSLDCSIADLVTDQKLKRLIEKCERGN